MQSLLFKNKEDFKNKTKKMLSCKINPKTKKIQSFKKSLKENDFSPIVFEEFGFINPVKNIEEENALNKIAQNYISFLICYLKTINLEKIYEYHKKFIEDVNDWLMDYIIEENPALKISNKNDLIKILKQNPELNHLFKKMLIENLYVNVLNEKIFNLNPSNFEIIFDKTFEDELFKVKNMVKKEGLKFIDLFKDFSDFKTKVNHVLNLPAKFEDKTKSIEKRISFKQSLINAYDKNDTDNFILINNCPILRPIRNFGKFEYQNKSSNVIVFDYIFNLFYKNDIFVNFDNARLNFLFQNYLMDQTDIQDKMFNEISEKLPDNMGFEDIPNDKNLQKILNLWLLEEFNNLTLNGPCKDIFDKCDEQKKKVKNNDGLIKTTYKEEFFKLLNLKIKK